VEGDSVIVDHLPDGRTIADTAAMAALTGRPVHAIRRHCPRESRGYDVARCETALLAQPDPIVLTARDAEQYMGIPTGTVRSWASRGLLHSLGLRDGWPAYDAADLAALRDPR
jgi:hypothetical protein